MKRTLNPPLLLIFLLSIILSSCDKCDSDPVDGKKFKGVVTLRAESDHNIGLIKVLPVGEEKELEVPSRGIIYKYEENQTFDLEDTVYFSINNRDRFQHATKITKIRDSNLVDQKEYFDALDHFQLNLHNADLHREGPQHKIWHIRADSRVLNGVDQGEIALTIESPPSAPLDIYFDANQMPADLSSDLFINKVGDGRPIKNYHPTDSTREYLYYNIYTSHEHAH